MIATGRLAGTLAAPVEDFLQNSALFSSGFGFQLAGGDSHSHILYPWRYLRLKLRAMRPAQP